MPEEIRTPDMVNAPPHYTVLGIEPITVIEAWKLGYCEGNAVKYLARAKHKGRRLEDLKKARWYLNRLIQQEEQNEANAEITAERFP